MTLIEAIKEWFFQITHTPHSAAGLRHRADKLNDNSQYQQFLYTVASAIDAKVISELDARKAVEYFRTGKPELMSIALKMIRANPK